MLFEAGGPGGALLSLVSYDQRGTGSSGLLRCTRSSTTARLRSTDAGGRLRAAPGPAARLLHDARTPSRTSRRCGQALGVEKLTLFGISYGTKLALAYARAHPDRVERMALDFLLEPDNADAFGREPYQAMAPSLACAVPRALRGVTADPPATLRGWPTACAARRCAA